MTIILVKRYLCACCGKNLILHKITEETHEGLVPDVSNCDLSKYFNPRVVGGKLLKNRPHVAAISTLEDLIRSGVSRIPKIGKKARRAIAKLPTFESPIGGICDTCFKTEPIKTLVKSGNITFEDKLEFRRY